MEALITFAASALMIVLGLSLLHRLNAQHDARTAAYHFSDPFPAITAGYPAVATTGRRGQATSRGLTGTWP